MQPNIFVVDDDRVQLDIMSHILAEAGFERLSLFSSPMDALQYARLNPPDLLIVDYRMPVYTGAELLRMLLEQYPNLAGIIITGSDVSLLGSEGFFVLRKGIANFFGQLISQVRKALERKGAYPFMKVGER